MDCETHASSLLSVKYPLTETKIDKFRICVKRARDMLRALSTCVFEHEFWGLGRGWLKLKSQVKKKTSYWNSCFYNVPLLKRIEKYLGGKTGQGAF